MTNSNQEIINADFIIFSIGRVSESWTSETNDNLVFANNPSTLGQDAKVSFITVINKKDEEGELTGEAIAIVDGEIINHSIVDEDDNASLEVKIIERMKFLNGWEKEDVKNLICESQDGSDYYFKNKNSKYNVGEGGEIKIEDSEVKLAPKSLVVNITIYRDASCTLNNSSIYGIDFLDNEPEEDQEFCGVFWHPSGDELQGKLTEAEKYCQNYDGSLSLYLNLINEWNSVDVEGLAEAWNTVLANLAKDDSIQNHMNAARIASHIASDNNLFRKIIEDAIKIFESKPDYVYNCTSICEALSEADPVQHRDEIYRIMNEAVVRANVENENDLCRIVESIGAKYSGTRFGDKEFALKAINDVTSRISDSKLKAKIKKKADKTLNDLG